MADDQNSADRPRGSGERSMTRRNESRWELPTAHAAKHPEQFTRTKGHARN